jgi:hypothetical protein
LHWALVEADLGVLGDIWTSVHIEDILYVPAELRVLFGRDAPLLLELGQQSVFFEQRTPSRSPE